MFATAAHMTLAGWDWVIIGAYLALSLLIGLALRRRGSGSMDDFFLAGRSLPWWLAGTSMVATTFAADTPLAVTEYVRADGIWRNWFWWSMALFHVMGVFLYARLWRRAEVLTDAELCELRYSGRAATWLRSVKAFLFAVPYNALVMGWVIAAMASVAEQMLGVNPVPAVAVLCGVALLYAGLSGLWGVVVTDMLQLALALGGTIAFAVLAVGHEGGLQALHDQIARADPTGNILRMVPAAAGGGALHLPEVHWLYDARTQFFVFVAVMWWANHNADCGGALMQRCSAAKDERHALWASFWFSLIHYAVRAWPWILVALCSVVYLAPESVAHPKDAYPMMMAAHWVPVGLRGVLVAAFLAAFMSTIDTHLNWGASYLVGDLYRRLIRPDRSERHYLLAARLATVLLMILAALTALSIKSISAAWELVWTLGAGLGPVLILRWFWWRINAWSELSALGTSLLLALVLPVFDLPTHLKALILVPITLAVWITVTLLTPPVDLHRLAEFHRRVRPGGAWRPVVDEAPPDRLLTWATLLDIAAGLATIYGLCFAIGQLLVGRSSWGYALLALAAAGATVLYLRHGRTPKR